MFERVEFTLLKYKYTLSNVFFLFFFGESFILTRYPGRSGDHNLFLSEPFVEEQKGLLSRSTGKKLDGAIMGRARKLLVILRI